MGNGALGALQGYVDLTGDGAIDAVLLSHCHIDHCADVASLYVLRHYHPDRPSRRLPLIGPSDAGARLAQVYGMADPAMLAAEFDIAAFGPEMIVVGPFTIAAARMAHPVETYAIRVSAGGRSLTYSGDTGPTGALVELARQTDLALFEASLVGDDNPPGLHMSGADAGRAALAAGVGRLLLTHLVAWNDADRVRSEAAAHFGGPLDVARAGLIVEV
jgi:ribonuclease BN (tRNA processing enzyme)